MLSSLSFPMWDSKQSLHRQCFNSLVSHQIDYADCGVFNNQQPNQLHIMLLLYYTVLYLPLLSGIKNSNSKIMWKTNNTVRIKQIMKQNIRHTFSSEVLLRKQRKASENWNPQGPLLKSAIQGHSRAFWAISSAFWKN